MISAPDQNGDGFYDINVDCLWIVTAEEGYVIRYGFVLHYIEYSVGCRKDVLRVNYPLSAHRMPDDWNLGPFGHNSERA